MVIVPSSSPSPSPASTTHAFHSYSEHVTNFYNWKSIAANPRINCEEAAAGNRSNARQAQWPVHEINYAKITIHNCSHAAIPLTDRSQVPLRSCNLPHSQMIFIFAEKWNNGNWPQVDITKCGRFSVCIMCVSVERFILRRPQLTARQTRFFHTKSIQLVKCIGGDNRRGLIFGCMLFARHLGGTWWCTFARRPCSPIRISDAINFPIQYSQ